MCIQQRVRSSCCAPGLGWEEGEQIWRGAKSQCRPGRASACSRYMDSSRPMARAGRIAVQVPGKEELGHPGLSQGKGYP